MSPSFLICYHLSLSLPSLPHLYYPPLSPAVLSTTSAPCALHRVVKPWPRPGASRFPDGLADARFRTDLSAADSVLPQTPGRMRITRVSCEMRSWGQERDRGLWENCITAEPVTYCISFSNSLRVFLWKCLHFGAVWSTLLSLKCWVTKKNDLNRSGREGGSGDGKKQTDHITDRIVRELREGEEKRRIQRGIDDSLWRHISHCARRVRWLHGLFSPVSSNGSVWVWGGALPKA